MFPRDLDVIDFFSKERDKVAKDTLSSSGVRRGTTEASESLFPREPEPKKWKSDLFITCSGDLVPIDPEDRKQLLNNFKRLTPLELAVWLAERTVSEKSKPGFGGGPLFYAYVMKDSAGSAQRQYSALGNWEDKTARDSALRRMRSYVTSLSSQAGKGQKQKEIVEEIEFRPAPGTQAIRIAGVCVGTPSGVGVMGQPKYKGKGLKIVNVEESMINTMYWVQSIIQRRVRRQTTSGEDRFSYQFTFCLEDAEEVGSGKTGGSVTIMLAGRDKWVLVNSTSDFDDITKNLPTVKPTLESLDKQVKALMDGYRNMEMAYASLLARITKEREELLIRQGIQGTVAGLLECWLKAPKDEKGNVDMKVVQNCVDTKIKNDFYLKVLIQAQKDYQGVKGYDWLAALKVPTDLTGAARSGSQPIDQVRTDLLTARLPP